MPALAPTTRPWHITLLSGLGLVALVLWLRWPGLDFNVWNVDEAIHAAAARTILDGGVLYRDAIDQRTPLSYYAVAAVFAVAGENNLWAVRAFIAGLIAVTAWLLFLLGRNLRDGVVGGCAALIYALLSSGLFSPGDAYAANTEWFLAFFSTAAACLFLSTPSLPGSRRVFFTGLLLGCAFLSKQPAMLELAAPLASLGWLAGQRTLPVPALGRRLIALIGGWLTPVFLALAYFAVHGALGDAIFYSWTYNLSYYGPEAGAAGRLAALLLPFQLLAGSQIVLLIFWLGGASAVTHRLLQRQPTPAEKSSNPATVYLVAWSLASLAGTASGGRDFEHYAIQFLPAFALGGGLAIGGIVRFSLSPFHHPGLRAVGALAVAGVVWQLGCIAVTSRHRSLPTDPSLRVSAYIREHSSEQDRIFVWGFHPDIYLHSDRKPASRFLYGSFLTGLIPWTNIAPERDTTYAIVPGAMAILLQDLTARPPAFIVDCSAGPNRHWQKYPLEKFPALQEYVHAHYRVVEAGYFVPQGFRLFQRRPADEPPASGIMAELPASLTATLALGVLSQPLRPVRASAPHGAAFGVYEGRAEYFAHAPSILAYRVPAAAGALRGGFGFKPGAYAADNQSATDGAEFIILWRNEHGHDATLFRRLLRPRESAADRGIQSFRVALPTGETGELILQINPGPADNTACDWTFWSDLMLENFR